VRAVLIANVANTEDVCSEWHNKDCRQYMKWRLSALEYVTMDFSFHSLLYSIQ
jgi:hypothetical protein